MYNLNTVAIMFLTWIKVQKVDHIVYLILFLFNFSIYSKNSCLNLPDLIFIILIKFKHFLIFFLKLFFLKAKFGLFFLLDYYCLSYIVQVALLWFQSLNVYIS